MKALSPVIGFVFLASAATALAAGPNLAGWNPVTGLIDHLEPARLHAALEPLPAVDETRSRRERLPGRCHPRVPNAAAMEKPQPPSAEKTRQ